MASIGSRKCAIRVAKFVCTPPTGTYGEFEFNRELAPRGFVNVGEGSSRVAYMHKPSRIVYKVPMSPNYNHIMENEWENARRIRKVKIDDVRIPKMNRFVVPVNSNRITVIAMENCGTEETELPYEHERNVRNKWSLFDLGDYNIRFKDNKYIVIDLGH